MEHRTQGRWLRLGVGMLLMLSLGTLYAWSIFRTPLSQLYPGWTATDLSVNFTISMICFCAGGFLGGKLSRKTNNTVTTLVGAAFILIGFLGVSFLPDGKEDVALGMLYLFYGVCSGLGTGLSYNGVLTGVTGWFPDRSGLTSGMLLTGFGLGSLLLGQLANTMIPVIGLPALFRGFAAGVALILVLGSRFVRLPDSQVTLPPPPVTAEEAGRRNFTPGEMVRHPSFWIFFAWNLCMCTVGLVVINSAAGIAVYYGAAAVLGLLVSVFNGASRIPLGICVDKLGRKKTMLLCNVLLLICGVLLTAGGAARSPALVVTGMLIMGVCYGSSVTVGTLVIRQFFGNEHYGVNLSIINCCAIPASLVGPLISSALQEAAGGDYLTTFVMVIALGVLDLLIGFFVRQP